MIRVHKGKKGRKTYGVRVYQDGRWEWVGTFATHKDARIAEGKALERPKVEALTVAAYVDRFLDEYERNHKRSSFETAKSSLALFRKEFARRPLRSITRLEAKDWAARVPAGRVAIVVTLFNQAVEDELLERNPFRGLARRTKGRSEQPPPTEDQMDTLLDACSVHGEYAPTMRALLKFAAYSGMRPGEIFALEWGDIDFDQKRIHVRRRVYRGSLDIPKSNRRREIALTPPARDALLTLHRWEELVFLSKMGKRLSQPTWSGYWGKVLARAGLDFDFYLATKHYCAHYLYVRLGLPWRVVKEQLGHIDESLEWVYGHGNIGALDEISAAFDQQKVVPLRGVQRNTGRT